MTPYLIAMESPLGLLQLMANHTHLTHVLFPQHKAAVYPTTQPGDDHPILRQAQAQLEAYFAAERFTFDLPIAPQGTAFQQEVWAALQTIPAGETWTYGALAQAIGRPKAVRAVGAANGRNPISMIIPCHRVIGANQTLTGYAGGLERKQWLLQHEDARKAAPDATDIDVRQQLLFPA